jgi:hypothetical protein
MIRADLSSMFQLAVGLNLGIGAIVIFAEPAQTQFRKSLAVIEPRLARLWRDTDGYPRHDARKSDLYGLNRKYLQLLSETDWIWIERLVWQSVAVRLVFIVGSLVAFAGLIFVALNAAGPVELPALIMACATNIAPIVAALWLYARSCWYEYHTLPKVICLQQELLERDAQTVV